jgi:Flp pilus assembly protein TadG
MKITAFKRFTRDKRGGVLVETTVAIPILMTFVLGGVDYLNAFSQWSAAAKAVEIGARIAAVSDPVASGLNTLPTNALSSTVLLGAPMPAFTVTCNGGAQTCTCTSGSCTGMGAYSADAMNLIVYGRSGKTTCGTATSEYFAGMCDLFGSILPKYVTVVYTQTGLGFAGRTLGPVPTITVSLNAGALEVALQILLPAVCDDQHSAGDDDHNRRSHVIGRRELISTVQ